MMNRNERTIEVYKQAGADLRLMKAVASKAVMDVSKVLKAADTDMLLRALDKIDLICSRAEDNMFRDYPEVSNDFLSVFYGTLDEDSRNEVDAEVKALAKETADGFFK